MKYRKLRIAWSVAWGIVAISILAFGTYLFWPVAKPEDASERQMRYLLNRDLLARHLQTLNIDIKRRLDEYLDIERESAPPKSYYNEFRPLDTNQLLSEIKRVHHELEVETSEQVEETNAERTGGLRDRQEKMMNELKRRIEGGPDMFARHRNIEQLQQIAHDMALNLKNLDAEAASAQQ